MGKGHSGQVAFQAVSCSPRPFPLPLGPWGIPSPSSSSATRSLQGESRRQAQKQRAHSAQPCDSLPGNSSRNPMVLPENKEPGHISGLPTVAPWA